MRTLTTKTGLTLLGISLIAFAAGWLLSPRGAAEHGHDHGPGGQTGAQAETTWTCSMHPQVRQPNPGTCPICAMDLIPLTADDDDADEGELPRLRVSERAVALMNIQTVPVQRREAHAEVRLPGRIAVDETRLTTLSAWFAGRVDRLFADFTGTRVEEGEHLLEIYSPQLFAAQEEYLQAVRASRQREDAAARNFTDNARERLRLFGLSDAQIQLLESTGQATTHLTYNSPADGVVIERFVSNGQYIETGAPLYAVADLSQVWVELEAYESELARLRFGQPVSMEVKSYPGEVFEGRIAYIDPRVDQQRRTARVRVNLPNPDLRLKPGMLAVGTVTIRIGGGGVVADTDLTGRWISPMHPEIVKDAPGACDICGMPLVPVEEMGYFTTTESAELDPLLIPATAPLFTGRRSLVYVRLPETERPTFEARQVTLGARLGDAYPVLDGLHEGELVVAHGQFKIDSELQIRGRPSMMAPPVEADSSEGEAELDPRTPPAILPFAGSVDPTFGEELRPLLAAHLNLTEALADDDPQAARVQLEAAQSILTTIGEHRLTGDAHMSWMHHYNDLTTALNRMAEEHTLDNQREHLQALTLAIESAYVNFGAGALPPVHRVFCPMVNMEEIGTWLQRDTPVRNPYWGSGMLTCGDIYGQLGETHDH